MNEYYNKEEQPITKEEWSKLIKDKEYCRIEYSVLQSGATINTRWIGVGWNIFETLVEYPDKLDSERYEYRTEEQAVRHHYFLCNGGTYIGDKHDGMHRLSRILKFKGI